MVGGGVSAGRLAAGRALLAIEDGPVALEDALADLLPPRTAGPEVEPKAREARELAWFLAFGVQRARGRVDGALRQHLSRPLASADPPVRAALRIGAFERLFARTPPHAAVDQAVELARALGAGRAHGLVNAVVRKVSPADLEALGRAERLDHPAWLLDRWERRVGAEAAEAWCRANGELPPLFLVTLGDPPPDGVPVTLRGRALPGVTALPAGDPTARPEFARSWVQDAGAVFFADLVGARPGERVLDACAAPGGKALRMAAQGARVVAADRDRARIELVRASAARLGLADRVETRLVDWAKADPADWGTFDAVLVDAPCSGLGTVRRHPEIRWRRAETDLAPSGRNQLRILTSAARRVRPGGRLVYAVCSPEPEEGADVVAAFLGAHPDFALAEQHALAPPERGEDAHAGALLVRAG